MSKISINYDLEKDKISIDMDKDFPGHSEIYKLIGKLIQTHAKKSHDYGVDDPMGNFEFSSQITNVPAWFGAFIRMTDKWGRLKSLLRKEQLVKEESLEDTLLDNALYSLIVSALYDKESITNTENIISRLSILNPNPWVW